MRDNSLYPADCIGLTLIELLISISLGLILINFMIEFYLTNKRSEQLQYDLRKLQYSSRSAITELSKSIKSTRMVGCRRIGPDFSVLPFNAYSLTTENKIIVTLKHELFIRTVSEKKAHLKAMNSTNLVVTNDLHFKPDDLIIISDCNKAEINQIKVTHHDKNRQVLTLILPVHWRYTNTAEVSKFIFKKFFVDTDLDKEKALFVVEGAASKKKIAAGITDFHISYITIDNELLTETPAEFMVINENVVGVGLQFDLLVNHHRSIRYAYVSLRE